MVADCLSAERGLLPSAGQLRERRLTTHVKAVHSSILLTFGGASISRADMESCLAFRVCSGLQFCAMGREFQLCISDPQRACPRSSTRYQTQRVQAQMRGLLKSPLELFTIVVEGYRICNMTLVLELLEGGLDKGEKVL